MGTQFTTVPSPKALWRMRSPTRNPAEDAGALVFVPPPTKEDKEKVEQSLQAFKRSHPEFFGEVED